MPEETISAFADHGVVVENSVEHAAEESQQIITELETLGLEMRHVTKQLVYEGVRKFIEPYDHLMKGSLSIRDDINKGLNK